MIKTAKNKIHEISKKYGKKIGLDLSYFVKNGFWVFLRQIVTLSAGLLLSITFARFTSQEVLGQYQLILSTIAIVSLFSIPGLNNSLLQAAAKSFDGDYKKVVKKSFIWSLLGVPALLIWGAYYYFSKDQTLGLSLMASSIFFPFFYAPNTWDSFLQGKKRFDVSAKYSITQSVVNLLATVSVIFLSHGNLFFIVLMYLASYTFFNVFYYFKSFKFISNSNTDKDTIEYGWFLTKLNIFSVIADNFDKMAVGIFLGAKELAVYFMGITVVKIIFDFSKTLHSIFAPKIAVYDTAKFKNYLKLFFAIAPFTIIIYFLLPVVIPLLFSNEYVQSVRLSQISIIFLPFIFVNLFYLSHFLYYVKNKKLFAWHTVILYSSKIIFMIPLMIYFGTKGLAFMFGFQAVLSLLILIGLNYKFKSPSFRN
jgi:O-antigen/teichoic acid export membrane protein